MFFVGVVVVDDGEKDEEDIEVCPGCELAEGESFMGGAVGTAVATIENLADDEDHLTADFLLEISVKILHE